MQGSPVDVREWVPAYVKDRARHEKNKTYILRVTWLSYGPTYVL